MQVWWRDCLLHAGPVAPGRSFSLGEEPADVAVCRSVLGSGYELVVVHRAGIPVALVPARAQGALRLAAGCAHPLGRLRREAAFRSATSAAIEIPLDVGDELEMDIGALTVALWRPLRSRAALAPSPDWRLNASLAAGSLAVLMTAAVARQAMPPLGDGPDEDLLDQPYLSSYIFRTELTMEQEPDGPAPAWDFDLDAEPVLAETTCRCGSEGPMGAMAASRDDNRYGVKGPQDNPDPHIARARGEMEDFPHHGIIGVGWGAADGPLAPWGRDDALGTDPLSAQGHLWGYEIADARGSGGLGAAASGDRTSKVILSTVQDPRSGREPPRVYHAGLQVDGALAPSVLLEVVSARFARFQSCYADELARAPEIEGRIDLLLEIEPSGELGSAGAHSSMTSPTLPTCLVSALAGLSFPGDEGGSTWVRYPLLFDSGRAAAPAVEEADRSRPDRRL